MHSAKFRRIALSMEGAIEGAHMGHPDFRANGRIFATLHPDDKFGMVKLTPLQQKTFIDTNPDTFAPENGAWGRQGCTRVSLASAEETALREAMQLALSNTVKILAAKRSKTKRPRR